VPKRKDISQIGPKNKEYRDFFKRYIPENPKLVFIAESPPLNLEDYFYFDEEFGKQRFFATIIKAVFDVEYNQGFHESKKNLLNKFQKEGFVLLDVSPEPIKHDESSIEVLREEKSSFLEGLNNYVSQKTDLIIIKESVHDLLYDDIKGMYNILNEEYISFPIYYYFPNTIEKIREVRPDLPIDLQS